MTNQYSQCLPAECAEPFETPLMDMSFLDLGQFNDWNEKIEWLPMQKYVTVNWWGQNDGLESPVHVAHPQHTMGEVFCALIGLIM